jgi:hypothetical protein
LEHRARREMLGTQEGRVMWVQRAHQEPVAQEEPVDQTAPMESTEETAILVILVRMVLRVSPVDLVVLAQLEPREPRGFTALMVHPVTRVQRAVWERQEREAVRVCRESLVMLVHRGWSVTLVKMVTTGQMARKELKVRLDQQEQQDHRVIKDHLE